MKSNIPDYRVTLDGTDLTPRLKGRTQNADPAKRRPRLVSITIAQRRGEEPDKLTIVIDDSDGQMAIPPAGKLLHVQIGWLQGSDVIVGLRDKGSFKVDSITHEGPPDMIMIEASSADMTGAMRIRREEGHHATTLGAIVRRVASRHGLKPVCAPALAAIAVAAQAQSRESDLAFLRRLGRERGAVAKIARDVLIFSPIAAGTTPSGKPIATVTIARRDGDAHQFSRQKRDDVPGVKATWHDRKSGKREQFVAGKVEGAKTLSRVYANEADAQAAAKAAHGRTGREPVSLFLKLALGRPDIHPETKTIVTGYKAAIHDIGWVVAEVTHTYGENGFSTGVKLEATG